jgi:hypothetical protein
LGALLELKIEDLSTGRIKPTPNGETPAANQPRVLPLVQSESGVPRVRGGQEQQDADRRVEPHWHAGRRPARSPRAVRGCRDAATRMSVSAVSEAVMIVG